VISAGALAFLCAASIATGALSALVGMAGGITLLALMLLFMDPLIAIPIHGCVQLVSNSSRAFAQRGHVRWPLFARFAVPVLPLSFAGLALAKRVPRDAGEIAIGLFVLVFTWKPGWLAFGGRARPTPQHAERRMVAAGSVCGFFSTTVGATGPLLAPFFLRLGLDRFSLIATQAACQTFQHLAKILVFGAIGFSFRAWLLPLAALSTTALCGTYLGTWLLGRVREDDFRALYTGVLTVIALRLVQTHALALWGN
jgi:uncharacterized membrane protein YfcA